MHKRVTSRLSQLAGLCLDSSELTLLKKARRSISCFLKGKSYLHCSPTRSSKKELRWGHIFIS
uniref:Uncharacterized protein n=1 Tax=Arundo donax TaxID=35708 RepID=A0A0A8ZAG3_ARUDO